MLQDYLHDALPILLSLAAEVIALVTIGTRITIALPLCAVRTISASSKCTTTVLVRGVSICLE